MQMNVLVGLGPSPHVMLSGLRSVTWGSVLTKAAPPLRVWGFCQLYFILLQIHPPLPTLFFHWVFFPLQVSSGPVVENPLVSRLPLGKGPPE